MFPVYRKGCQEGIYEKIVNVTDRNTDAGGIMQPGDLAREAEKITEEQLKLAGLGQEEFKRRKKLWVVVWSSFWIAQLPECGDTILLRVWPGKKKNAMYPRKFAFYTQKGQPLVCASSLFVFMDSETRKLAMPIAELEAIPGISVQGEPKLPQLQMKFPEPLTGQASRIVRAEEIDSNGHLNNACYLDWAMHLAGELSLGSRTPQFIWINYHKELVLGQEVTLHYAYQKNILYIHGMSKETSSFMLMADYGHQH